ncbi:polysaccharide pyruvyl transferase family protein [Microvirga aerilata]|uniref:Polysaccharide pyruvyl transferase family protein n=1 Tax=Microvirga aerilata TaxID=670292 RepID=A0A937CXZ9_9HYPH|nr:polysaccharide pyruvyl transferase family protein [Microvirga aerilata]MBL0406318.1 polysaccharide pyruvyl transferase family protein [Microvirga aerilata]
MGAPVSDPPADANTQTKFDQTGKNTGNLLIGHALRRELAVDSYAFGTGHDARQVNENFDLIAIPAANFIYEHFDFGYMADFIERTTLPCLMVGLGAQSSSLTSLDLNIPAGTRRLLKIIAERSNSIGVRGEYTASVLEHLGITNVTLTGCPSLYMTLEPELKIRKRESDEGALRVAVNGSNNVIKHSFAPSFAADVERHLLDTAVRDNYAYVLQNEFPEIDIVLGRSTADQAAQASGALQRIGSQLGSSAYTAFLQKSGRVFFSVDEWSHFIRRMDFSIGTRFHGNMIALLSGVPALIIPHDTRTLEMSQLMKIPHVTVDRIGKIDIARLYDSTSFDEFSRNYAKLYQDYIRFLDLNNVAHRLNPVSSSLEVSAN